MSDVTSERDDLTPTQEYTIAGVVILLFGLLYWLFNYGFPNISFNANSGTSTTISAGAQPNSSESSANGTASTNAAGSAKPAGSSQSASAGSSTEPASFATKEANSTAQNSKLQTVGSNDHAQAKNTAAGALAAGSAAAVTNSNAASTSQVDATANNAQQQATSTGTTTDLSQRVITDPAVLVLRGHLLSGTLEQSVLMDSISFARQSAEAELSADTQTLDLAALMLQNPATKMLIRGHTADEGTTADSKALSLARATALGQKLVEAGAAPKNIIIMGMGDAEPLPDDNNQQNRGSNRRIDVAITQ